ncbi:MAG: hypothetical protein ABIH41_00385 [Nanoarchaeota archaeon]
MIPSAIMTQKKWDLIGMIAQGPKTPAELAEMHGSTMTNVLQQLKIPEALGYIKKERIVEKRRGKPRYRFALASHALLVSSLHSDGLSTHTVLGSELRQMIIRIMLLGDSEEAFILAKFFLDNPEFIENVDGIALVKAASSDIELFVLTEHLELVRQRYSTVFVSRGLQTRKVICWSHNEYETSKGLDNQDRHFMTLLRHASVLYDPTSKLGGHRRKIG